MPGGTFIFDVFTPKQYENIEETRAFSYQEAGFWNRDPHLCLESLYLYDYCNTFLRQYIILTSETTKCYNIWEHTFTAQELCRDLIQAGFESFDFFGDVAGAVLTEDSEIICSVAHK